ncbi:MAG: hypothetical protein RR945_10260 [Erysipelotrichaceae bacterium]
MSFDVDPANKPFLGAKDFVCIFGRDVCSINRAYILIRKIKEEKLFDESRCPRKNVVPRDTFLEYFNMKKISPSIKK